jgi:hypothetical protein
MDDSLKDLEAELKGLRLQRPSAELFARLERELAEEVPENVTPPVRPRYTTATNLGSWKWFGWRMASVAAAVALVGTVSVVTWRQTQSGAPQGDSLGAVGTPLMANRTPNPDVRYQPVAATNVLYDVSDEGYVQRDDEPAARRVRARYVDTYEWKNPQNNASLRWSVPRDEVRVIRASWN